MHHMCTSKSIHCLLLLQRCDARFSKWVKYMQRGHVRMEMLSDDNKGLVALLYLGWICVVRIILCVQAIPILSVFFVCHPYI